MDNITIPYDSMIAIHCGKSAQKLYEKAPPIDHSDGRCCILNLVFLGLHGGELEALLLITLHSSRKPFI
jgi:hypothetical protein